MLRSSGADRTARRQRMLAQRARVRQRARREHGAAAEWLQVNCSLFTQGPSGPAYAPWAHLQAALSRWRTEHRFEQFFFMRKPPALRLRFRGAHLAATLEPVLLAWLADAEARNLIRSFHFATYEPETFLFGGPLGMDIAHDQFDRDSQLTLEYERLVDEQQVGIDRAALSLALMHDLFTRFGADESEGWDIWQRIWHGHGCPELESPSTEQRDAARALVTGQARADMPIPLIEQGRADNEHIAGRLRAAEVSGRLSIGPRAWLAMACTFHWNRLGLSFEARLPLLASMLSLLDPHRTIA